MSESLHVETLRARYADVASVTVHPMVDPMNHDHGAGLALDGVIHVSIWDSNDDGWVAKKLAAVDAEIAKHKPTLADDDHTTRRVKEWRAKYPDDSDEQTAHACRTTVEHVRQILGAEVAPCLDCPIGGREGNGPICPNVDACDRECRESVEAMHAERQAFAEEMRIEREALRAEIAAAGFPEGCRPHVVIAILRARIGALRSLVAPKSEVDHALATAPAASADQSRPCTASDDRVRPSSTFMRMQIGAMVRRTHGQCVGTHNHCEFFDELVKDLNRIDYEIVRKS